MRNFLYGLLYTVMGLAVLAVIIAVCSWYDAPEGFLARSGGWPLVAVGGVALSWVVAFRRDAYAAWLFLGIFGAVAIPFGVTLVLAKNVRLPPTDLLLGTAVTAFVLGCAACAWIYWRPIKAEEVLPSRFGRKLGDMRGVLMAFDAPPQVAAGEVSWVRIYLENCWDAPRAITFDVRLCNAAHSAYVRTDPRWHADLGPRQAGILHVPIGISPGLTGPVILELNPSVGGDRGRRLISRRGQTVQAKVSTGLTIAAASVGHVHAGGGLQLCLQVVANGAAPAGAMMKVDPPIFQPISSSSPA